MKLFYLVFASLLVLFSCKEKRVSNEIIIEGLVKNIPDGKVYLTEAHSWQTPLDSTVCINGIFKFTIKTDSAFVPYMAAIYFPDSSKSNKIGSLFFRNYMLGKDSVKNSNTGFYLEKGYTRLEGVSQSEPYIRVFAGKETDIMYTYIVTNFGWLGNIDSNKRVSKIEYFKKQIRIYPFSYFLLHSIFNAKKQYSKNEIQEILELFNADVQKSKLGDEIRAFINEKPELNIAYPNLNLLNSFNQRHNIIDSSSKINMLVFWASWCGPCRLEIPVLKEIQNEFKGKGLNLVSISIDVSEDNWKHAVQQEKMSWPQYLVNKDKLDSVKQQFNIWTIPLVIFTDKTGKEITKFTGYDIGQKMNYRAVIKKIIETK